MDLDEKIRYELREILNKFVGQPITPMNEAALKFHIDNYLLKMGSSMGYSILDNLDGTFTINFY